MKPTKISTSTSDPSAKERRFYYWLSVICLAVAVLGFVPTYWLGLARGATQPPPVVHFHAVALYGWVTLFVVQAWLAKRRASRAHRAWGLLGIALATLATVSFVLIGLHAGVRAEAAGYGAEMRAFLIVTLAGAATFAALFALAIATVRRPDAHKRLMLAATVSLLGAPIARWFIVFLAPETLEQGGVAAPPPVIFSVPPALLGDLILIAAMIFDRRMRGSVHPVLAWATAGVVAVHVLSVPISQTALWDAIAAAFLRLA